MRSILSLAVVFLGATWALGQTSPSITMTVNPQQTEADLSPQLILLPASNATTSGMLQAQKSFLWMRMRGSAGYWRFVVLCEQKRREGIEFFSEKDWALQLATQAGNELRSAGISMAAPAPPPDTKLARLVQKFPFLFDPTTDQYRWFLYVATSAKNYETVEAAMPEYLEVAKEKAAQAAAVARHKKENEENQRKNEEFARQSKADWDALMRSNQLKAQRQAKEYQRQQDQERARRAAAGYNY